MIKRSPDSSEDLSHNMGFLCLLGDLSQLCKGRSIVHSHLSPCIKVE